MSSAAHYDNVLPLTATDRCDRCGARAYVLAIFDGGSELLLCAHHGRKHRERLVETAAVIVDVSFELPVAA